VPLSKPRLRFALSLLCLIACTWQGFVAHTHFHGHTPTLAAAACLPHQSLHAGPARVVGLDDSCNSSGDSGSSSCPLCEVALHGAASALPAHDWLLPSFQAAGLPAPTNPPSLTITAVSFDWNSRGPPLT